MTVRMSQGEAVLLMIVCFTLAVAFSGCSNAVNTPSPLRAARPATEMAALANFSDMGIVLYTTEVLDSYEGGALMNEILALTGGGIIGGLGTGAVAAPPAAQGLMLGANGLLMLFNLWRPIDRTSIYNQGAGLLRESMGVYLQALITDGYCTVPTNRVTPAGAALFAQTNATIKVVNDFKDHLLNVGSASIKVLQAAQEQAPATLMRKAIPEACK